MQGIVLVTFPAASTIFTDPSEYDLSSTQYGALFLPQVVAAITTALLGASLSSRFGAKRVYLVGLAASLVAMALLIVSSFIAEDALAYWLLLLATASLGAGFGLAVPTLNTFAAAFHPAAVDRSILVLNALLGLGTVLAPVFVAVFVGLGFWWGLPVTSAILLAALVAVSLRLPLRVETAGAADGAAGDPDSRSLLGLRGLRRALRHLRDPQWQLVAAGHDRRTGRVDDRGGSGPHRLLGDGHRRPGPLRRDPAAGSLRA